MVNASTPPSPAEIVTAEVAKYGDELVPGAAEKLGAIWASLGTLGADKRAEQVAKNMEGEFAGRYRDPEKVAAKLANGADPGPLRRALARNADRLAPGAVDALAGQLAHQVAGKRPHEVAGFVERFLASRDAHPHLAVRPELPAHEQRLTDLLYRNFSQEMSHGQIAEIARDNRGQLRGLDDKRVVEMVGRTLRLSAADPRVSGGPGSIEHRPAAVPSPAPARATDGTFKAAEATPPRKSLVR